MADETADGPAPGANGRSSVRDSMMLAGTIHRANGAASAIRVRNLSAGGLMAETDGGFLPKDKVEVDLRGLGLVAGTIAWVSGTRIGIAFAEEIDPQLARRKVTGTPQPMLMRAATSTWRPPVR